MPKLGHKKERLVFVNDRGLAQPTKKHEKRRSSTSVLHRVLFREVSKVLVSVVHKALLQRDLPLAMEDEESFLFQGIQELLG